jgi:hypothetical protein
VLLRKERTRQWRIVPTHATTGIADHVQRSMGRWESVVEELALTRQHLGPSVEERARHNDDARPRAFHPDGGSRRRSVPLLLDLRDLVRGLRRSLVGRETLVECGAQLLGILREGAKRGGKHQRKKGARQDVLIVRSTQRAFPPKLWTCVQRRGPHDRPSGRAKIMIEPNAPLCIISRFELIYLPACA